MAHDSLLDKGLKLADNTDREVRQQALDDFHLLSYRALNVLNYRVLSQELDTGLIERELVECWLIDRTLVHIQVHLEELSLDEG